MAKFQTGQSGNPSGRPAGSRDRRSLQLEETLARLDCDPIEGMAHIARGDAVALGWMTQEELDAPAKFNRRGAVIRPSGREIALRYLPPELRAQMFKELAGYVAPKRRAVEIHPGAGRDFSPERQAEILASWTELKFREEGLMLVPADGRSSPDGEGALPDTNSSADQGHGES